MNVTELWIERGEEETAVARTVRRNLPHLVPRLVDDPLTAEPAAESDAFGAGKKRLVLARRRAPFLEHCPAGTSGLVCCNYLVVSLGSNCPMDCSYCFLQAYLKNNPALKVFTNPEDALAEIDRTLQAHPQREFRVGTGELVDSLALDGVTETSDLLVPFFAARRNGILELKTKTAAVDRLLRLDGGGRVVVSWSVNTRRIVQREEEGTASLEDRIGAARRVQEAGYKVGFHFDPIVEHPGWEGGYREAVEAIAASIDPRRVAWISLGSLRMTPQLKSSIRARRLPGILASELVPEADGKMRVWRALRVKMYRTIAAELRRWSSDFPLYLCMEPPPVWSQVLEEVPADPVLGRRLAAGAAW